MLNFKQPIVKNKGFTLIELLVVIAIIAILATIVIMVIVPGERAKEAREAARDAHMIHIGTAIQLAALDCTPAQVVAGLCGTPEVLVENCTIPAADFSDECTVVGADCPDNVFDSTLTDCVIKMATPVDSWTNIGYHVWAENYDIRLWANGSESQWYCDWDDYSAELDPAEWRCRFTTDADPPAGWAGPKIF